MISNDELRRIVEEEIRRAMESSTPSAPAARSADFPPAAPTEREPMGVGIKKPFNPELLERIRSSSPSLLGVGRVGTRYLTNTYVRMRADHAIAKDAVYSEADEVLIEKLGCLSLKSECQDKEEFLLHPNHGRRLCDDSAARLQQQATKGVDVQLIVGDGLSAWAAEVNGPELLPAMEAELQKAGFSVGKRVYVRYARVGVQDHIGTLLGAKATAIMLGERPGLGTGDSLSIYIAYGPKLDQDNAEKNCISNVRQLGIKPAEAAKEAAAILKRAFETGRGGVAGQ